MANWRTWLTLARASNLPTVWSNCLAGWWLGGGGHPGRFALLIAAVTVLYVAGMFLNDAFDVEFDRTYRSERPVPSGKVSLTALWRAGLFCLALGALCLIGLGTTTGLLGITLAASILLYDAIHKMVAFSPLLLGLCRFLVCAAAASIASDGVTGSTVWCALALGCYVTGLSFFARRENAQGAVSYWPLPMLAIPVLLAIILNAGVYRQPALLASAILVSWTVRSLRPALWGSDRQVGRAVAGLLAGIPLVDLLATVDAPHKVSALFLALFALSLLFQRFIPAT